MHQTLLKVIHSNNSNQQSNSIFLRLSGNIRWRYSLHPQHKLDEYKIAENISNQILFFHSQSQSFINSTSNSFKNQKQIISQLTTTTTNSKKNTNFLISTSPNKPMEFGLYFNYSQWKSTTNGNNSTASNQFSPTHIYFQGKSDDEDEHDHRREDNLNRSVVICLPVDILTSIAVDDFVNILQRNELYLLLRKALVDHLMWMLQLWDQQIDLNKISLFHYQIHFNQREEQEEDNEIDFIILTRVYSPEFNDKQLRKQWHKQLNLPLGEALLRLRQRIYFPPRESLSHAQWISPHLLLPIYKPTSLNHQQQQQVHLVQGHYLYAHYLQGGEKDDKWGCAYRSLQTLISWFFYQHFIDLSTRIQQNKSLLPTLKEIQEILVKLKDKPSTIIGSKEWIGSYEVSLCLWDFCKTYQMKNQDDGENEEKIPEPRLIYVANGGEMMQQVEILAKHFSNNRGGPVMIGGGQYAYTILGVSFPKDAAFKNKNNVKFLILDPHYIVAAGGGGGGEIEDEEEDVKRIIDKGWCGWKDASFWSEKYHYNMCLPLPPKVEV